MFMSDLLYQKIGLTVSQLAQDLLSRMEGERIPSISEYEEKFRVSRGTVQNSLSYLKERGAISLVSKGHLGTYIEKLDYHKLQDCSVYKGLLGSMPLPYSRTYQGLATALYRSLSPFSMNLVYSRGSEGRLQLVTEGVCQFTACSRYAAKRAIERETPVEIAVDLGSGTYLSRHVLILKNPQARGLQPGMRVAYDRTSLDQRHITEQLTQGIGDIRLVELRAHQTVNAIRSGMIDAGVWNMDEILESGYKGLHVLDLDKTAYTDDFSSAVLVIRQGEEALRHILCRYVEPSRVREIQEGVRTGQYAADY